MGAIHRCLYCGSVLKRGEGITLRVTVHGEYVEQKVKDPRLKRLRKRGLTSMEHYTSRVPFEETAHFCSVQDALLGLQAGLVRALAPPGAEATEMVEGPLGMEERPRAGGP